MAIGWNTRMALPRMRTYADADRRERETKPVRGDEQGRKPLAQRSMKWRHIKREADGTITVLQGSSPLLRYFPDDRVEVSPGAYWNKATEHDILGEVLGLHLYTEARDSWVNLTGGTYRLRPSPGRVYNHGTHKWEDPTYPHAGNFFRYEDGKWAFLNPESRTRHTMNRKAANRVRKEYAEFKQYLSAMCKLRKDSRPEFAEYIDAFDLGEEATKHGHYIPWWLVPAPPGDREFNHEDASELCALMRSNVPADQYKAYLRLVVKHWTHEVAVTRMDRCIVMHHHNEVLDKIVVEPGVKGIDKYRWAIPPQS